MCRSVAPLALALAICACRGGQPSAGFEPALPPLAETQPHAANGSIFNVNSGYAALVTGNRAHAVGDLVTILLYEKTSTSKSASSKNQRDGGFSLTPPTAGPFAINPEALKASGQSSFKGDGSATQSNSFAGELSVTIAELRPNGTVLVRGEKQMLLSQGREWIQFSGIVRLADIDQDNRVTSSRVADARIEYAGNGPTQTASREGWLSRFFNKITPF